MSPNQPKTPVYSFRLDDETVQQLRNAAEAMNTSMTEAVKRSVHTMNKLSVLMQAREPLACPLGQGHTQHIWELPPGKGRKGGVYRCAGQPFANGYDPIDDA